MEISIENYKNIKNLQLDIEEGKVNFIYGISGSGKSSIIEAITEPDEQNTSFGLAKGEKMSIIPILNEEDYSIYNNKNKMLFLESQNNSEIYRVIFSQDNELEKLYKSLMKHFVNLSKYRPMVNNCLENIIQLKKELGMRSNSNKIDGKNNITKLEEEINNDNFKINYNFIKKHGIEYLEWLKKGVNFKLYKEGKCPFCTKKLTNARNSIINNVIELTPENYNAITSSNAYMNIFKITPPNYTSKRDINRVKKSIKEVLNVECELKNINNIIDEFGTSNIRIENLKNIKISSQLKNMMPEFSKAINDYNLALPEIKMSARKFVKYTERIVKKNLSLLNSYLELLGIPYEFVIEGYDTNNNQIDTILKHKDNILSTDNRRSLSYGETNIIALLLFILSVDKKYIIIDDPASSYDENRKNIIYNLLIDNIKNKTCIVLSHSQSFIKNAIINRKNNNNTNRIGNLYYLQFINRENSIVKILDEDLDNMNNHILGYIEGQKMSYFQKIINFRILCELTNSKKDKNNKLIYGYLSAILHLNSREKVYSIIADSNSTEEGILDQIKKKYKIELEPMPEKIEHDFDYNKLSIFEKVAYARENLNKRTTKYKILKRYSKDVLSEIVHLNNQSIYTLNPYKYNIYPQNVIDIVNDIGILTKTEK